MQYIKTETGFEELPQRNVDFGGGLERMAVAVADIRDVFKIDVFAPIITKLEEISGKTYAGTDVKNFRIIADHIRAIVFLISDGVIPSNSERGYIPRRLLRRALFACSKLEIPIPQSSTLIECHALLVEKYKTAYPRLLNDQTATAKIIKEEVEKFDLTIDRGTAEFKRITKERNSDNFITAKEIFYLFESFGMPVEYVLDLVTMFGFSVKENNIIEVKQLIKKHQELSRTASVGKFKGGLADHSETSVKYHTATHLLHKALKIVLGDHVQQKGSNITPERLRFDFSHPEKMTSVQIKQTENIINEQITKDLAVTHEEMSVAQAKEKNALGLFEHKYGEKVSVYSVGDFSCEICGGPHVERTGTLGTFKIIKEESASAGVRRIKAVLE